MTHMNSYVQWTHTQRMDLYTYIHTHTETHTQGYMDYTMRKCTHINSYVYPYKLHTHTTPPPLLYKYSYGPT